MRSLLVAMVAILAAVAVGASASATESDEFVGDEYDVAKAIQAFEATLDPKTPVARISRALETAVQAIASLEPPARPDLVHPKPDADQAERDRIAEQNKRRMAKWAQKRGAFLKRRHEMTSRWIKALGAAMALDRDFPWGIGGESGQGQYLPVYRRALELLRESERPEAAMAAARAIPALLAIRWKFRSALQRITETFESLPKFQSPEVLNWLCTTFVGHESNVDALKIGWTEAGGQKQRLVVDPIVLAFEAMARHEGLPGPARHRAVRALIAKYRGSECDTDWSRVGAAVVEAAWRLAGKPTDEPGMPTETWIELVKWYIQNQSPDAPPWKGGGSVN